MKILIVGLLFSLSLSGIQALAAGAHGVFRVVKGQVTIQSAQSGKVSRARLGAKVFPGDVISASKESRAKVVMVDKNEINISPDTKIKIEKYEFNPNQNKKDVLLNVIYGKVRSKVEQKYDGRTSKFQIKTPSAVAGVRGTDFITGYSASTGASQVVTFEGKVQFGSPGPGGQILNAVEVSPGQMAEFSKGGMPPQVKPVPKESLRQMDQESKADTAPDSTETESQSSKGKQEKKEQADKKQEAKKSESGKEDTKKEQANKKQETNKSEGKKDQAGTKQPAGKRQPASAGSDSSGGKKTAGSSPSPSSPSSSSTKGGAPNGGTTAPGGGGGGIAGPGPGPGAPGGSMIDHNDLPATDNLGPAFNNGGIGGDIPRLPSSEDATGGLPTGCPPICPDAFQNTSNLKINIQ